MYYDLEGKKLTFRAEAENALNRVNRGLPASTLGSSGFGTIRSLAGDPRLLFDQRDLVVALEQVRRQVPPHGSATGDHDAHGISPPPAG